MYVQEVNVTQITILESRAQRQEREQQTQPYQTYNEPQQEDDPILNITSDDLPF